MDELSAVTDSHPIQHTKPHGNDNKDSEIMDDVNTILNGPKNCFTIKNSQTYVMFKGQEKYQAVLFWILDSIGNKDVVIISTVSLYGPHEGYANYKRSP